MANINDRPPLPRLSTILRTVGNDPSVEERWVNALYQAAFSMRTSDIAAIKMNAAMRLAAEFETLIRARCKKANRGWRWSTSQRRVLAESIINAQMNEHRFYYEARTRAKRIIEATQERVSDRHYWVILDIANVDPRDTRMLWYEYSLHPDGRCNMRDHLIVYRAISTCREVLEGLFGRLH